MKKYTSIVINGITCSIFPFCKDPDKEFEDRCYKLGIAILNLYDETRLLPLLDPKIITDLSVKFIMGGDIEEFMNNIYSIAPNDSKH